MCSDIVSRLPNEVSNYEPCYFLHGAGCDRGKEGTQRERDEEGEEYRENNGFDRDSGSLNKKKKRERKQRNEEALITDAALEQHQLYSAHNYLSF